MATNDGKGFNPSIGNYTTDVTDVTIPTVGPPLAIQRIYNSLDTRTTSAFGTGWSSVLDMKLTESFKTGASAQVATITYPGGQTVSFGLNSKFSPPSGRYSSLVRICYIGPTNIVVDCAPSIVTGVRYKLVDKDGTEYVFNSILSGTNGLDAVWGLYSITDVHGRSLILTRSSGQVVKMTSSSGRALTIGWSGGHVSSVSTDPAVTGDSSSISTWNYGYTGDNLTSVCPPTSATSCTSYSYETYNHSPYRNAVVNLGASTYLRPGTTGVDANDTTTVNDQIGNADGRYVNVTLGQTGPLAGSAAKGASFNGTSSYVELPAPPEMEASQRTVSVWFKTSGSGTLLGQSTDDFLSWSSVGTWANYTPVLYVDNGGYLRGQYPTVPTVGAATQALGTLFGAESGKCLNVPNNNTANGTQLVIYTCGGGANEKWSYTAASQLTVTIGSVTKCLDVTGANTANGTTVQLWDCGTGNNQKWIFTPDGNVISLHSGRCLDVVQHGTDNLSKLNIWDCYPDLDGHRNQVWTTSAHAPILASDGSGAAIRVNNGAWHHAALTSRWADSSETLLQELYLDGVKVGETAGMPASRQSELQLGTGFRGATWPNYNGTADTTAGYPNTGTPNYFNGQLAEFAMFNRPLSADEVGVLQSAAAAVTHPMTGIKRPSGRTSAAIAYSQQTGLVTSVTDENGGVWQIDPAKVTGSYLVHRAAVLGAKPSDYWRFAEGAGVTDAVNEVTGGVATYNEVDLGIAAGPLEGNTSIFRRTLTGAIVRYTTTSASYNGTSSFVKLPATEIPTNEPMSISMWFKTVNGDAGGGTLFSYQTMMVGDTPTGNWVPALYVGRDGYLYGKAWGLNGQLKSAALVNDGAWHHVTLAAGATSQTLFVDDATPITLSGTLTTTTAAYAFIGAGAAHNWPQGKTDPGGYFLGNIAEVSMYKSVLTQAQVAAQYDARNAEFGNLARTYTITDPGGGRGTTEAYEVGTGRKIAETNGLGKRTSYGYDAEGYMSLIADPVGNVTLRGHDVRGNVIQETTCQDYENEVCSTTYSQYWPDKVTRVLQPDSAGKYDLRNDKIMWQRGPGSTSDTDNQFLTTFQYDATTGDRLSTTDPLGRVAGTTYTTSTTPAEGGGYTPAGLALVTTTAEGASKTAKYYANGDVAELVESTGKSTKYVYDNVGNVITKVENSGGATLTTTSTYDKGMRLVTQTDPAVRNRVTNALHTAKTTYEYDVDGLVLSTRVEDTTGGDAPRWVRTDYDQYGLATRVYDSRNVVNEILYDKLGHPITKQRLPDGVKHRYVYDAAGQLTESIVEGYVGDPNDPAYPKPAADLTIEKRVYYDNGLLLSVTDANLAKTVYTYTDNGLTETIKRVGAGGEENLIEEDYYDASGFLVKQFTNNHATRSDYVVDAVGRAYESTLDVDGLNRVTKNVLSDDDQIISSSAYDGTTLLAHSDSLYNAAGQLIAINRYNGDPATTPVARWQLNQTSGTIAADTAGNSKGVASNVTWSTSKPSTRSDLTGSAIFNGDSSKVAVAGSVFDPSRSFTVSAWANISSLSAYDEWVVMRMSPDGTAAFKLGFSASAQKWYATLRDGKTGTAPSVWSSSTVTAGQWTHLAVAYDADAKTLKLYVNGSPNNTTSAVNATNTAQGTVLVGSAGTAGTGFPGSLADVQIHQAVLSDAQIVKVFDGSAVTAKVARYSYTVDNRGLITSETDPLGRTTLKEYDEAGRLAQVTSPSVAVEENGSSLGTANRIAFTGYNTFGEATESKDPKGRVIVYGYDAEGRQTSATYPSYTPPESSTPVTPVSTTEYDDDGRITKTVDATGIATQYFYDQLDRVWKIRTPAPTGSGYADSLVSYDLNGNLLRSVSPTGAISESSYDFMDRKLTDRTWVRQDGSGTWYTMQYAYGIGGWLTQTTSPAGVVSTTGYNAAGQPTSVTAKNVPVFDSATGTTTATDLTTTIEYDRLGRQTKTINSDLTYSTVGYDLLSRPVIKAKYSATYQELAKVETSYDSAGQVVAMKDPQNHSTTYAYDATGLLTSQTEPVSDNSADSITTTFGYDIAGNQTRMTNGLGNVFVTTYNSLGLEESTIEPATDAYPAAADRTYTKAYDKGGRLVRLIEPGGVSVDYSYDNAGNLIGQSGSGAEATTASRTFGYDLDGRVTSFSGTGSTTNTLTYDDRGLLRSITGNASGDATFTYAPDGQLASRADAAGSTAYTYDAAGRLATLTNGAIKTTYSYDQMSQVSRVVYGNSNNRRDFSYYPTHLLQSDTLKTSGGAIVGSLTYEWDANGNPTKKTTTGFSGAATNVYTYDYANRLTSWTETPQGGAQKPAVTYEYDKAGNRTKAGDKTFSYDQRNRLTYVNASTQYTYTARGSLRSVYDTQTTQYTSADAYGQIISQGSQAGTQTYEYDAIGRAIQPGKKFSGLENDLAADLTAKYVRDPAGKVVGERDTSGANEVYAWTDLHDDIFAQTGAADSAINRWTKYDPLGDVKAGDRSNMLGSLGYQSEWTDTSTGRVNMAARWYNPATGQFDSRDSYSNNPSPSVSANRYAYANANPLLHTDPSGHKVVDHDYGAGPDLTQFCKDHPQGSGCVPNPPPPGKTTTNTKTDNGNTTTELGEAYNPDDGPPVSKEAIEKLKSQLEAAQKVANKSFLDVLLECGAGMILDFLGITDMINCFTKGDLMACGEMILGLLPIGKLLSMGKKIFKLVDAAFSAYKAWKRAVKIAEEIIEKGKKALEMLDKLNNAADKINNAAGLLGYDTGLPTIPFVPTFGGGKPKKPKHNSSPGKPSKPKKADPERPADDHPENRDPHAPDNSRGNESQGKNNENDSPTKKDDGDDNPGGGGSCSLKRHSFDPRTPVLMADGSTRAIEDIELGDEVVATDPGTGKDSAQKVTALHQNLDLDLTDVMITSVAPEGQSSPETSGDDVSAGTVRGPTVTTLHTTQHHPFWDATDGQWVDAADLKVGHELVGPNGEKQYVAAVQSYAGAKTMRDLTVDNLHTYYVIAGGTPVLVHNNNDQCRLTEAAHAEADMATSLPAHGRPQVAEAIQIAGNGPIISATSVTDGSPVLHPRVASILASVPLVDQGRGHGKCGLPVCISIALFADMDPQGAAAAAVTIRTHGNPKHGREIGPCKSCRHLVAAFDLDFITDDGK
ncbi:LamG-like jellyroll fold domain-containing protein [Hamadaea sp. NPDC050747]|uniref:LamG-like jellyroll fold domain-containing protein n=1 Tax=Hamadaea sp. NPDC050747 TaxID=3155789 RepID=UPI0034075140